MNRLVATVLFCACALPGLRAQATRALPRIATDAFAGANAFSIPPTAFRAQYWFAGDNLPTNTAIQALGIRAARNTATAASARVVEITVSNAVVPFGGLTTSFAQNLGALPTTFFAPRNVNFPAAAPTLDPNVAAAWFPGDAPFPFFGPNLVIDFRGGASAGAATVPNDGYVATPGAAASFVGRTGCGGGLQAVWQASQLTWTATALPAGVPVAFNLGVENVALGGVGLPVDLGAIGMPGCHLAVFPLASAQSVSNGSGVATLTLPAALSTVATPSITVQAVHARVPVPQTIQDFATTNGVTTAFGYVGGCNALFAASDLATNASQGPQPINASIVLLVR